MTNTQTYPIGTPGKPWGVEEKAQWLAAQTIKRSYQDQVVAKIDKIKNTLSDVLVVEAYGSLSRDPSVYSLYVMKSKEWNKDKPTILITGGVHGYETSGVQGALRFVEEKLTSYCTDYNFIVAPCISPWGYETINRWNPSAIDPNRSFHGKGESEESTQIIEYVANLDTEILAHIDLHETTDTDDTEFRPALAARDAIHQKSWHIPDGFYTVGDTTKPAPEFLAAIIQAVEKVTHIAPADENNQIIGSDVSQLGVISYPKRKLGLCAGFTDAPFVTTTEVYPDSPKVDDENCIQAQVAAVTGALDFLNARI